jgi:hypothetical protein
VTVLSRRGCFAFFALLASGSPALAQGADRDAVRSKLDVLLTVAGLRNDVNLTFRQSTKNPYNFVASMVRGLANAESLEIIISVTQSKTLGFRVYPHYRGGYLNVGRARDATGFMRRLLSYSDQNFLYWGADEAGDVFSGFTFTLESGFPEEAIIVVLRSIHNEDQFVGELLPLYDGSAAQQS